MPEHHASSIASRIRILGRPGLKSLVVAAKRPASPLVASNGNGDNWTLSISILIKAVEKLAILI